MRVTDGVRILVLSGLLLSLAQFDARAACALPRSFSSLESFEDYSYIYTPGYPFANERTISDDFDAIFWSFGGGDPALGAGNDIGEFGPFVPTGSTGQYYAWIYPGGIVGTLLYPALIYNPGGYSNWADSRIDGCIDYDGSDPVLNDEDQCMLVLLADQSENGATGYFGLIAQSASSGGDYLLNRAADSGPIVLEEIPSPNIVSTSGGGLPLTIELTLAAPTVPPGAIYDNSECPQDLVVGYKVYAIEQEPAAPLPDRTRDDGDPATGWEPAPGGVGPGGGPIPIDQFATVLIECGFPPPAPTVLALSLVFESGFETPFVSRSSTSIDCGGCLFDGDNDGFCGSPPQDCNDFDADVYPNAPQICDGINNDCFDQNWPDLTGTNEADDDLDGFTECAGDCADADPERNPNQPEVCNGLDDDCDDLVDEDALGVDSDSDSVANLCDNCIFDANPLQDDQDSEGIGDVCDNCVTVANLDQADFDGDAEGDRCDLDDGLIHTVVEDDGRVVWQPESGFDGWNSYRGDLAVLRGGGDYTQLPGTNSLAGRRCGSAAIDWFDSPAIGPGETAFYLVAGSSAGIEGDLGVDGSGVPRPNANPCP